MKTKIGSFIGAMLLGVGAAIAGAPPPPPKAPVRPVTDDYFGTKVADDYRYMENLKDPEVQRWMKAQADYTRATLDSLPGRAALVNRITELVRSTPAEVTGLQVSSGRYYSLRTPAGAQSPKLYVRDGVKGEDRLLIDPEKLSSANGAHLSISSFAPSPDGRYVAYGLSPGGTEQPALHVFDVRVGRDLAGTAGRLNSAAPHWRDSRSFFYTRRQILKAGMAATEKFKNERTFLHRIGRSFEGDPVILGHDVDPTLPMTETEVADIATAADSHYAVAFVTPGTDTRLRVYAAPAATVEDGKTRWRAVAPSYHDQYISGDDPDTPVIALAGDTLYWLSRKNAPRGEILKLDLSRDDSKPEVVVPQGDLPISAVYAGRGAIYWRVNDAGVNSALRLRLAAGAKPEQLRLPYAADVTDVHADPLGDAAILSASSWLRSPALLAVDAGTGAVTDSGLQPAGPYDHPDDLKVDEVKVKSWDGVEVPLSIIHNKGMALDGSHPAAVFGYGAYGISLSPHYDPRQRAAYEHNGGFAFGVCHVRGGGEYGEAWHKAGYKETKPNTWKDFIACGDYLIAHKYTSASKLTGFSGSAGGITTGRAIEERPDLFAAAIIDVPVADTLRSETTGNGVYNVPEFGSVKTEAGFKALYAMSAYAHVEDGVKYPAVLIVTGADDPRVDPWMPAKFAARLQAASASGKPVLLRVDYDAGHTGIDTTVRQMIDDFADNVSFALWQAGDPDFQPNTKEGEK